MISPTQFKAGMVIKFNNQLYSILSYQHVKPGKGPAYYRTKLKNINDSTIVEQTFRSEEKIDTAYLDEKKMTFLYEEQGILHFMDSQTYEQIAINKKQCSDIIGLLSDGTEVTAVIADGKIIDITLPNFITMRVAYAEPGARGDTVKSSSTKTAELETGARVQVPLFINKGDIIKIDTRKREYVGKAK